jgi:hypothetical protein
MDSKVPAKGGAGMSETNQPKRFYSPLMTALVRDGRFTKLPGSMVKVLNVLDVSCNERWECSIGDRSLARLAGVGHATVTQAKRLLTDMGVLTITQGKGTKESTYRIHVCAPLTVVQTENSALLSSALKKVSATDTSLLRTREQQTGAISALPVGAKQDIREQEYEQKIKSEGETCSLFPDGNLPKNKSKKEDIIADEFDKFWSAYPKKIAKEPARKAWHKLNPSPELITEILTAIEKQQCSDQWTKDRGKFIPHPATWLHQKRWADEVTPNPTILKGNSHDSKSSIGNRQFREANRQQGKYANYGATVSVD